MIARMAIEALALLLIGGAGVWLILSPAPAAEPATYTNPAVIGR